MITPIRVSETIDLQSSANYAESANTKVLDLNFEFVEHVVFMQILCCMRVLRPFEYFNSMSRQGFSYFHNQSGGA